MNQCTPIAERVAKVEFDPGIDSVRGILMGTDPFYIRRYPERGGGVMHIVQARPNRSGHTPSASEAANRICFGERFGKQRHAAFMERKWRGQLELPLGEDPPPTPPSGTPRGREGRGYNTERPLTLIDRLRLTEDRPFALLTDRPDAPDRGQTVRVAH